MRALWFSDMVLFIRDCTAWATNQHGENHGQEMWIGHVPDMIGVPVPNLFFSKTIHAPLKVPDPRVQYVTFSCMSGRLR